MADFQNIFDATNSKSNPYHLRTKTTKLSVIPGNKKETVPSLSVNSLGNASSLSAQHYVAAKLQFIHGMRFSDIKSIKHKDILSCGLIRVVTTKGNTERIVYFPDILTLKSYDKVNDDVIVFAFSYRQYSSALRRAGFYKYLGSERKKLTITHLFRHNRFNELMHLFDVTTESLTAYTGHKSKRSLNYYSHKENNVLDLNRNI